MSKDATELERLLWNLVSGIRVMAESDAKKSDPMPGLRQTEDAVQELAAYLAKVKP
jgi:hypothetical protein